MHNITGFAFFLSQPFSTFSLSGAPALARKVCVSSAMRGGPRLLVYLARRLSADRCHQLSLVHIKYVFKTTFPKDDSLHLTDER